MSAHWAAILGASSELALQTVRLLARDPSRNFALQFRTRSPEFDALVAELGGRAVAIQADLSHPAGAEKARAAFLETCPKPRLILCAASPALRVRRAKEITPGEWSAQLFVQAIAPGLILPALLPGMKGDEAAQLIFVLSEVVREPAKGMADYITGKFAALGLMRALQAEFAGVKIHGIAPGMMETRFLKDVSPLVVEAAKGKSGGLLTVKECAEKLARLAGDPAALIEDPLYVV